MSEPGGAGSDRAREAGWSWLHLPALAALAVAQPLLDLLSRAATFFVAHRFSRWEVVALVGLLLALPLPLVLLEAAVRRLSRRAARWLRLCGIAVLAGAIALQLVVRGLLLDGPIPVALAALGGIAFAAAYHRWSGVRQFTGLLALGLIAVPAVFFLAPEVRGLSDGRVPAAAGPALGTRAPIVMVVLDELSLTSLMGTDGRVDARRFPHFAALAERSTWFRNAVAASDTTGYALPAIVSGRLPAPGDHALAAKFPDNLFTAFGREYRIYAVESLSALCPLELNALRGREPGAGERWAAMVTDLTVVYAHLLLPRSMREGLPEIESTWQGFGASEDRDGGPGDVDAGAESRVAGERDRVADFRAVVDAIERREQPSLYFVHVLLPHVPWQYTASGKRYSAPGPLVPGASASHWGRDPVPVFEGLRRYLEQLQFVDALLGELLGKLEQEGLLEESALVVTADHGVSFRPGDSRRGLTPTNAVDILPIPLFVKAPGQMTGVVDDTPVSALSTLPTLFDVLGVRAPFPTDAGSALRPQSAAPRRVATAKGQILEVPAGIDEDKNAVLAEKRYTVGLAGATPEWGDRHADLIGLAVEQLPREPDRVLAGLVVEGRQVYEDVDLTSPSLPVWVAGGVGESGGEIDLVVAVNGIVSATTRARRTPDSGTRFATLVSERHLKQGANRVELFAVLGEGAARRLQRLVPASTLGRLELGSSGVVEAIAGSGGRTEVRRGDLRGRFSALPEGDVVVVSGWAWDVRENRPPAEIAVFSEGESVFSGSVTERRGGVTAGDHLPAKPLAGFRFEIPARSIPDLERTGVRVFARGRSGTASELEFSAIVSRSPAGPGERGGLEVRAGDGRRVRFPPGAISGEFERNSTGPGSKVELRGWAGDLGARAPAREVLVFAGSALLARVPVTGPSRLSESRRGAELAGSGFRHVARAPALAVENLGVYAISASGHAAALVERRPPTRLLAGKGGTPRALQRHGATSPLQSAEITGAIGPLRREAETVLFSGWVVDRKSRREPLEILVFFRGVLVATGEVQAVRALVNRRFDAPRTLRNGFEIAVERTAVPDLEQHGVQVVAVAAGGEPALLGPTYRLRRAPFGNDSIEVGDGRRLPVRGRTEAGALQAWRGGDALELRGRIGAGKLLLVFEGERCAYIGKSRARPPEGAEPPHDAPSGLRELCVRIRSAAEPGTELSAFEVDRAGTAAELPVQTSTGAGALCEPQPEAGAAATSKESDGSDEKKGRGVAASPR